MGNNLNVRVTADVADLTAKMAVSQEAVKSYSKALRDLARQQLAGDGSDETKRKALEVAAALGQAKGQVELYTKAANAAKYGQDQVRVSAGSMKAGMQSLSFQLNDVATMFALGAKPMQIFASQGSQVIQSLQMMTGNAKGVIGILGGPWGAVLISATTMLTPFIAKLLESENALEDVGEAAENAMAKLNQSMASASTVSEALTANGKAMVTKMGELAQVNRDIAATNRTIKGLSGDTLTASINAQSLAGAYQQLARQEARRAALQKEIAKYRGDINETLSKGRALNLQADAQRRLNDLTENDHKKKKTGSGDSEAKEEQRAREQAERAALQEKLEVLRQQQSLSDEAARTEIELSRMALESKLADVDTLARSEQISAAEAIQRRADLNAQIASLDGDLEARLYASQLLQLTQSRDLYGQQTAEYADYTRKIELLNKAHLGRMAISKAAATEREKQIERDLENQRTQEQLKQSAKQRQIISQTFRPFADNIARMITLQQGFGATVKGIWSSLSGAVNQAISNMVMTFITGLFIKEAASDKFHAKEVLKAAKEAAANAYAATAKIPIVGPILAPIAAAAAFVGTMAFSAEDGWDVPGGAGAGIDGRGGRPAIIHPREMVLPARLADTVRQSAASMNGLGAQAAMSAENLSLARATFLSPIAEIHTGERISPRSAGNSQASDQFGEDQSFGSSARPGSRGQMVREGDIIVNAVDAHSVTRMLARNNRGVAKALQKAVRANVRPAR